MEDPINYCTKKCKRWPSKLCSVSYKKKKDISSLKRSSLFLAYLSEILMHQKPILIKHSRDPIIGKKPLSSMWCLWQPITAASDHLKWHLTGNICIFLQSWWDQTEEAPRDCVSKLPRDLLVAGPTYGFVGTWKWHWGGKVREVLIHSIQMSVWRSSDQMSTSDHGLRSLYRICWVLVSFCLEFLFFFLSLLHSVYMLAASCSLFLFNDVAYILISSLFLLILCSCAYPTLLVSSCALFLPSVYICMFCVCMYLYT